MSLSQETSLEMLQDMSKMKYRSYRKEEFMIYNRTGIASEFMINWLN